MGTPRLDDDDIASITFQARAAIPPAVQREVWKKWERRCGHCGWAKRLQLHHIIPVSSGGSNTADNLAPLCQECHREWHHVVQRAGGFTFAQWVTSPPYHHLLGVFLDSHLWTEDVSAAKIHRAIEVASARVLHPARQEEIRLLIEAERREGGE